MVIAKLTDTTRISLNAWVITLHNIYLMGLSGCISQLMAGKTHLLDREFAFVPFSQKWLHEKKIHGLNNSVYGAQILHFAEGWVNRLLNWGHHGWKEDCVWNHQPDLQFPKCLIEVGEKKFRNSATATCNDNTSPMFTPCSLVFFSWWLFYFKYLQVTWLLFDTLHIFYLMTCSQIDSLQLYKRRNPWIPWISMNFHEFPWFQIIFAVSICHSRPIRNDPRPWSTRDPKVLGSHARCLRVGLCQPGTSVPSSAPKVGKHRKKKNLSPDVHSTNSWVMLGLRHISGRNMLKPSWHTLKCKKPTEILQMPNDINAQMLQCAGIIIFHI